MICQFCEIEYPAGTERCKECGAELLEALPDEDSEPTVDPLCVIYKRGQLSYLVDLLEKAQIPYTVYSGTALFMLDRQRPRDIAYKKDWEARVVAMSSRWEEAEAAAQEAEEFGKALPDDTGPEDEGTGSREPGYDDVSRKMWPR